MKESQFIFKQGAHEPAVWLVCGGGAGRSVPARGSLRCAGRGGHASGSPGA